MMTLQQAIRMIITSVIGNTSSPIRVDAGESSYSMVYGYCVKFKAVARCPELRNCTPAQLIDIQQRVDDAWPRSTFYISHRDGSTSLKLLSIDGGFSGVNTANVFPPLPPFSRTEFIHAHLASRRNLGVRACYFGIVSKDLHVFKHVEGRGHGVIANIIIPAGAHVFITPIKCRASKAFVHSMVNSHTLRPVSTAKSWHSSQFVYRVGEMVVPDKFSRAPDVCASGIHFYTDVVDAIDWGG